MSRYVIIGAGAVGATTAAELHRAGREVILVARGRHLELLRERGLDYVRPDGVHRLALPVAGGPDEVELRAGDVLVLATKSQDTEAAVAQWAWQPVGTSSAARELTLVLLQNGLDNIRPALRRFAHVVDTAVLIPSTYLRAGEVVSPAAPNVAALIIGTAPHGLDARVTAIADDLRAARFAVQTVPDIARWKAGKLIANVAYNLDALYGPGPLRDQATTALRDEARQVLAAAGLPVSNPGVDSHLDLTSIASHPIDGYPRGGSSTWQSLARATSHESDFLNGEIVLLARLHGVPAPVNTAVQQRVARAARERTAPGSLTDDDLARTLGLATQVLIDAKQLRDELAGPRPPVVLDVRWALGDPDGRRHHEAGHLPGAVYVDLDTELAAHSSDPTEGRHPLPQVERLQEAARRWGLTADRPVVVYDNTGGQSAARAWWLLRWAGVPDVRILDGAFAAWTAAALDVETGPVEPNPGDVTLTGGRLPTLTADEAAAFPRHGILLDARAGARYRGEVEPVDPRPGHIPGARSAPTADNLGADGAFLPALALRERFAALGVTGDVPVAVYCGSGVTAAHELAALAVAGIDAALFPGSWSAWSSDPARPVATGPDPEEHHGD